MGGTTTTYTYSADGLRQSATTGGNTTTYTWDVNRSLPEVLDDGTSQYIYGLGNTPIAQVSGTSTHYNLTDGVGSVMATTDSSGNVVNTYTYDAFGATTSSTGSQSNQFQFAGQQTDATGLEYLRARYYDPVTGTFLSSDPVGVIPAWPGNPYAYVNGSPATLVDPYGLFGLPGFVKKAAKAVGSALSAVASGVNDCAANNSCRTRVGALLGLVVGSVALGPEGGAVIAGAVLAAGNGENCFAAHDTAACVDAAVGAASAGIAFTALGGLEAIPSGALGPMAGMLQYPSAVLANACLEFCPRLDVAATGMGILFGVGPGRIFEAARGLVGEKAH